MRWLERGRDRADARAAPAAGRRREDLPVPAAGDGRHGARPGRRGGPRGAPGRGQLLADLAERLLLHAGPEPLRRRARRHRRLPGVAQGQHRLRGRAAELRRHLRARSSRWCPSPISARAGSSSTASTGTWTSPTTSPRCSPSSERRWSRWPRSGGTTAGSARTNRRPPGSRSLGYAESVLVFVAAVAVFRLQPEWFDRYGHPVAADRDVRLRVPQRRRQRGEPLLRAPGHRRARPPTQPLHLDRAGDGRVPPSAACCSGWRGVEHWLLILEASLIGWFAVFWGFQTWELWDQGLRTEPPATTGGTSARTR